MLAVFGLEGFLHVFGEALTLGFAVGVVKEDVGLGTFAATVHMNEDGAAVFILLAVFTIKGIDFVATLLKALYLVQRDGRACRFHVYCSRDKPRHGCRLWHLE